MVGTKQKQSKSRFANYKRKTRQNISRTMCIQYFCIFIWYRYKLARPVAKAKSQGLLRKNLFGGGGGAKLGGEMKWIDIYWGGGCHMIHQHPHI